MSLVFVVLPFGTEKHARMALDEMTWAGAIVPGELLPELEEAYAEAAQKRAEEGS